MSCFHSSHIWAGIDINLFPPPLWRTSSPEISSLVHHRCIIAKTRSYLNAACCSGIISTYIHKYTLIHISLVIIYLRVNTKYNTLASERQCKSQSIPNNTTKSTFSTSHMDQCQQMFSSPSNNLLVSD